MTSHRSTIATKFPAARDYRHWVLPDGTNGVDASELRRRIMHGLRLVTPANLGTTTLELTDEVTGVVLAEHDRVPVGARLLMRVRNLEQPRQQPRQQPPSPRPPSLLLDNATIIYE